MLSQHLEASASQGEMQTRVALFLISAVQSKRDPDRARKSFSGDVEEKYQQYRGVSRAQFACVGDFGVELGGDL